MENKVNELDARSITLAENPTLMSDEDYDTLLRIVEAEAGSEISRAVFWWLTSS